MPENFSSKLYVEQQRDKMSGGGNSRRSSGMVRGERFLRRMSNNPFDALGLRYVDTARTYKHLKAIINAYLVLFKDRNSLPPSVNEALHFISVANIKELKRVFESVNEEERDQLLSEMQRLWKKWHNLTWNGDIVINAFREHYNDRQQQIQYLLDRICDLAQDPYSTDEPLTGWRR